MMDQSDSLGIVFLVILILESRYESFTFMNNLCKIIKEQTSKTEVHFLMNIFSFCLLTMALLIIIKI